MDRDELNARLDEVLVGGREPVRVCLIEYDPAWPARFERERARIARALEAKAIRIEHIGSTAVPGLAAKPVVDVLVTVTNADREDDFRAPLERAGYVLRVREPGHRMFRTPERDVHVHVWADGDPEVGRYLTFRDRLGESPEERGRYERLKRELATRSWEDMNHYAAAKGPLIAEIVGGAAAA